MADNDPGIIPRPSDVFGPIFRATGLLDDDVSNAEYQARLEQTMDANNVLTGTPPLVGLKGLTLFNPGRAGQLAAVVGSWTAQNTAVGHEVLDTANSGVGAVLANNEFQTDLPETLNQHYDLPDLPGDDPFSINIPWLKLLLVGLVVVAVNAFAGGFAEGLTE